MKTLFIILALAMLACSKKPQPEPEREQKDNPLAGTWQLAETFIGNVPRGTVVKEENGYILVFNNDLTYIAEDRDEKCSHVSDKHKGTYAIRLSDEIDAYTKKRESLLIIDLDIFGSSCVRPLLSPEVHGFGFLSYNELVIYPKTRYSCDEGCSQTFKRIK